MLSHTQLIVKSFAGMLFLLSTMAIALFLPYGSFAWPLAWAYLAVFFAPVLLITGYLFLFDKRLLQSRLAVGPLAEPTVYQKIVQGAAGLLFLGIYVISAFDHRFRWSGVPLAISWVSAGLCLLAFVFVFFVFRQNTFLSATIEVQQNQQVISTGLYGFVRHPMYSGAFALLFFTPLALGSFWGLIPTAMLAGVIALRAIDEERNLSANLRGYKEYCKKVRYRFVPFIF
jgi:protein-S-isoprenylcysteine O-methyltransferase Ste14